MLLKIGPLHSWQSPLGPVRSPSPVHCRQLLWHVRQLPLLTDSNVPAGQVVTQAPVEFRNDGVDADGDQSSQSYGVGPPQPAAGLHVE